MYELEGKLNNLKNHILTTFDATGITVMPVASFYEAYGSRREVGRKIEEWGCKKENDAKDVKGTDIVSGYAGVFESNKVAEAEYETAVAAFPIDQADIRAINSEAGWTKRFDDQRCLKSVRRRTLQLRICCSSQAHEQRRSNRDFHRQDKPDRRAAPDVIPNRKNV